MRHLYTPSNPIAFQNPILKTLTLNLSKKPKNAMKNKSSLSILGMLFAFILLPVLSNGQLSLQPAYASPCYGQSNGSASANPSGGVTPYTYLWTDGSSQTTDTATGLSAGTYTVTVTDNASATASAAVTVIQPRGPLAVSIPSYIGTICGGATGSAMAIGTGGAAPFIDLLDFNNTSVASPYGSLLLSGTTFYGTVEYGGTGNGCIFSFDASDSVYTDLHDFNNSPDGAYPTGSLILSGTTLYGMTASGGANSNGCIFSFNTSGNVYTDIYDFSHSTGGGPDGDLILSGNTLYGMASQGGLNSQGVIFSFNTSSTVYTDLYDFNGTNGGNPNGSLILSGTTLYGMTPSGGADGVGCIFSLDTVGNVYTDLLDFNDTNGGNPNGSLTLSGTTLYGMTYIGGANGKGVIFSFNTSGNTYTDLYDFSGASGGYPNGSLTLSGTTLYGMTQYGGANNAGCIFSLNTSGNVYTDLLDFNGTNGGYASGSLTLSGTTLYGMTPAGGANNNGLIFGVNEPYSYSWAPSGGSNAIASSLSAGTYTVTLTDANSCTASTSVNINTLNLQLSTSVLSNPCYGSNNGSASVTLVNGSSPFTYSWSNGATTDTASGLSGGVYTVSVQAGCGQSATASVTIVQPASSLAVNITSQTGSSCVAAIGSATAAGTGGAVPYTDLYDFGTYGTNPYGNLTLSGTTWYGMTRNGGANSSGCIFSFNTSDSVFTDLLDFNGTNGANPQGSLTLVGTTLYGMTQNGGANNDGNIFSFNTSDSVFTDLYDFNGTNGANPQSSLTLVGTTFYGMAQNGGANNDGCIFSFNTSNSAYTDLLDFTGTSGAYLGANPQGSLTLSGTILYGMTNRGGAHTDGCLFSFNTNGNAYTDLLDFSGMTGTHPYGDVTISGTTLYGTTTSGGTNGDGNVFSFNTSGDVYADLVDFTGTSGAYPGERPTGSLTLSGTTLYGMTYRGGANNDGTVFSLNTVGNVYTDLLDFNRSNGKNPNGSLVLSGATLYGMTNSGGANSGGVIFSLNAPYSYSWSTGASSATASGLSLGTYTVTVTDANSCTASTSVAINLANLQLSTSVIYNSCYGSGGGSASVTSYNGTSPYTYSWSSGTATDTAGDLSAGSYTVSVQDNCGASGTASVIIAQPTTPLAITIASYTNTTCGGTGSATANAATGGYAPHTNLLDFNGTDGQDPNGSLTIAGNTLYGMTESGGANGQGCIFSFNTSDSAYTDLLDFNGTNGSTPTGSLILSGTTLYGMTSVGGANGQGCIFSFNLTGNVYTDLFDFNGSNGANPKGSLVLSGTTLYGMTQNGGGSADGNIFSFNTSGNVYTDLFDFNGSTGQNPSGSLILSGTTLYGMTQNGGANSFGSIFSFNTSGNVYTDLLDFNGSTGQNPAGSLILSGTTLYGMTVLGGGYSAGSIFSFDFSDSVYTDRHDFDGINGSYPSGDLILSGTTLYGMTNGGGPNFLGCVFSLTPFTYTDLLDFNDTNGASPNGDLTLSGTTLYGMTGSGGTNNDGIVFSLNAPYSYNWSPSGGNSLTASNLNAGTYTITVTDGNSCTASASVTITQPNALSDSIVTLSTVNVSCNGGTNGSATVDAINGTSPYTYSWNDINNQTTSTATGLSAGTYTATVWDSCGSTAAASVTITQPNVLSDSIVTLSTVNVSCNGGTNGSATVDAINGTSPYTYSWNDINNQTTSTATGLSAGTYTATVWDSCGSTAAASVTITQPNVLSDSIVTLSTVNVSCNGGTNGSATVDAINGTSPYTYSWNDPNNQATATATGLSIGTYTVTVWDSCGASASTSVTITQPLLLTTTATVRNEAHCNVSNGSAFATPSGGVSPYTYSWTNSSSALVSTSDTAEQILAVDSYTVTVTDANGCTATASITITQALFKLFPAITEATCNGDGDDGTINLSNTSGGTSPYIYSWSGGSTTTNPAITGLGAGTYTVAVNDANGCSVSKTETITHVAVLPVASVGANVTCNGSDNGQTKVSVTGGSSPYTYSWTNGSTTYQANGLSAGTYTVLVTDKNGCTGTSAATVTQPAALRDSVASATHPTCAVMGTATIGVKGGSSPYSYVWSPAVSSTATATGLTVRSYEVQVKDKNGCFNDLVFNITQPLSLRDSIVKSATSNAICANGRALIGVKYGTPPYTYSWSPSGGTNAAASGLAAGTYTITVTDAGSCSVSASITITQINIPTLAPVASVGYNVSCFGGSNGQAKVSVSGGTAPYTFSWSPLGGSGYLATGLFAGTYSVTVTDNNGCSDNLTATVTQPAVLFDSLSSVTYPLCTGGTATAAIGVRGGTAPYKYTWTPNVSTTASASDLSVRGYVVQVKDANGCYNNLNFSITQPISLRDSIVKSATVNTCNGTSNGSATVGVKYGSSPYTYSWSSGGGNGPTASDLSAGTYTVTVSGAGGCSVTASVTITQPGALSPIASVTANATCYQSATGKAKVSVSGGSAPYTYSWSPVSSAASTVTGLSAGTYTITVRDACSASASSSVSITQPVVLFDSVASLSRPTCGQATGKASVGVTGGTPPYRYVWTPNVSTTDSASGLSARSYVVQVKDVNGCFNNLPVDITCSQPVAAAYNAEASTPSENINLYPNPNTGQFTISGLQTGMMLELYDYTGKKISTLSTTNETMQLNIFNQANGVYLIRILDKDGNLVDQKKVVKTQ